MVGACRVDQRPAGCRDSVPRRDEEQAFPEGEVQAAVINGGCDVPELPVVPEQCTTPLDGGEPAGGLLGTGTCGNEALHAELRGVFRQAYYVTVPTFRLKLDLFKLSKQVSFDGLPRRIPLLRQMNQGLVVLGDV